VDASASIQVGRKETAKKVLSRLVAGYSGIWAIIAFDDGLFFVANIDACELPPEDLVALVVHCGSG